MDSYLVAGIVFLAVFVQSLTGFGLALVAMALMASATGIKTATPLVALVAVITEIALILRYRNALDLRAVRNLVFASLFGIPVGVLSLRAIDERISLTILGVVVSGYALYALISPRLPQLRSPVWSVLAGFLAGMLGGAYNTSGPPVIIYGDCQRWPSERFKVNLQAFFIVNSSLVLVSHGLAGNLTPTVLRLLSVSLPSILLGLWIGIQLDKRLSPAAFRKVMLVILALLGLRMLL